MLCNVNVRVLIAEHIERHDLCPGANTVEQWSSKKWVEARVGNRLVPLFPARPIRDALNKHDVHHILTGYSTRLIGECEIAAWELASGGCHLNALFWLDRLTLLLMGLVCFPLATVSALRRGVGSRNLYAWDMAEVLDMEVTELEMALNLKPRF